MLIPVTDCESRAVSRGFLRGCFTMVGKFGVYVGGLD